MDLSKRVGGFYPATWVSYVVIIAAYLTLSSDAFVGFIVGFLIGVVLFLGQAILIIRRREQQGDV